MKAHVVKEEAKGWGMFAMIVVGGLLLAPALLGMAGPAAVNAVGNAADAATCWPIAPACPPERARPPTTPTTGAGMPRVSDEELAKRQAAKALGDSLPPVASPPAPNPGVPTLANPGAGGGGVLSAIPGIGGAIQSGVKALGPGMRAIGK